VLFRSVIGRYNAERRRDSVGRFSLLRQQLTSASEALGWFEGTMMLCGWSACEDDN